LTCRQRFMDLVWLSNSKHLKNNLCSKKKLYLKRNYYSPEASTNMLFFLFISKWHWRARKYVLFLFLFLFVFFSNLNLPDKWSWPITSPGLFVWDYFLCEKYLLTFIFLSFYSWCSFSLHQFHMQTYLTRSTCWLEKGRFRLKNYHLTVSFSNLTSNTVNGHTSRF